MNAQGALPDSRSSRADWYLETFLLTALVMLALGLRLIRIDVSLWEDEVRTYQGATRPLYEAYIHRTQFLYYVLAHFTLKFADTVTMLRLPSVVAGVAGVAALYGFTRQVAGRTTALLAAYILALSSYHVDKSQEARFYALVMLASVLMVWSLWRAVSSDGWKAWGAFVLAANLGIASQFTVVPYVAALVLAAAVWIVAAPRGANETTRSRQALHLLVATLLSFAGLLISIAARGSFPYIVTSGPRGGADVQDAAVDSAGFVDAYRLLPSQYIEILHGYVPRYGTWIGFAFLAVLLVGVIALGRRSPLVAWLMAAQLVLVPIPLFVVHMSHWYHERYFSSVYPYYALSIALGCTCLINQFTGAFARLFCPSKRERNQVQRALAAVLLTIFVLGYAKISSTELIHHYQAGRLYDWKTIVHYLAPQLAPGDTIAVAGLAVHGTQHLPKAKQVFPSSHPSLEFYLPRELKALGRDRGAPLASELRIVGAGSQRQIKALSGEDRTGNIFIIVQESREPERAPHEDLDALPTVELTRANGLELRKIVASDSRGGE